MIIAPDFLDHWKTRLLVDELAGDELAPLYLIRLWAHCQTKKTHRLGRVSASAIKSICRYKGDAGALWLALQNSGYVIVKNEQVEVHEWSKYNQGLITSWENGKKGGRPKKPTGNPQDTCGVPAANPEGTDKIGLDKIGLDIHSDPAKPGRLRNVLLDAVAAIGGANPLQIPKGQWPHMNKLLQQIKSVSPDVTVEEIQRRERNYRLHFPDPKVACTPDALVKWWARCDKGPQAAELPFLEPSNLRAHG